MKLSLRSRYLIYIIVVHLALVGLTWLVLQKDKLWFIASELLILTSAYIAIRIYKAFRQPSEFIASGVEAIKDKDFTVKFVPTGNDEVDGLIHVYNLMIDQLRQERTRQAEQRFFLDKLIEAAPIAILIFDYDERIAEANPKAAELLGQSADALRSRTIGQLNHPVLNQLAGAPVGLTHTVKPNGVETYRILRGQFMDRGFQRQFMLIEELTAEIIETEKKAYGKVIRMMAHEVNNSIGAVSSILTVTESELENADLKRAVRVAIERNDRLNRFMRRFADVVRLPAPMLVATDVTELARNVHQLMEPQASARGVSLTLQVPDSPVIQPVDVGQMEQVLVNVVKNAIEACGHGQTVVIRVSAQQLIVRNDGTPIPDSVAANLFNPFFSTKPDGQGIGLTLTREILLNHGFTFSLLTEADGWTAFTIRWNGVQSFA
ncbi:PAS domain-containing protein [Spirosoma taeanense]|uniref:histidine kinase n=1 Tax=Spirosoma taeanense TaxID=2735870 RepID=A0A6M5Y8T0_9BACT|nr:ATP-binding protein [Spirosoma taeanense]QJW89894.1 PAS domain-containing protein [Spirosoma taeanense]